MRNWINAPLLRALTSPASFAAGGGRQTRSLPASLQGDHGDAGNDTPSTHRVRTVWISDVHLGTPGCQAHALLDFLKRVECDTLYLVGDIIDGWQLRRSWYWPQVHNDVVQKLLRKARKGTRVIYVPGNHDECARWLALLGDSLYEFTLKLNRHLNSWRARAGLPYWSLSKYLKLKVKRAVSYVGDFEAALAREARKRGVDGLVCGHIHHAEMRKVEGILYCNDGDWVESLTALIEHADGTLAIVEWGEVMAGRATLANQASPIDEAASAC